MMSTDVMGARMMAAKAAPMPTSAYPPGCATKPGKTNSATDATRAPGHGAQKKGGREDAAQRAGSVRNHGGDEFEREQGQKKGKRVAVRERAAHGGIAHGEYLGEPDADDPYEQAAQASGENPPESPRSRFQRERMSSTPLMKATPVSAQTTPTRA